MEGVEIIFRKNIELDENILRNNRISLLIQNQDWLKLFGDSKDKSIQDSKEKLLGLINKNAELEAYSEDLQNEKIKCMKMILKVSNAINNEESSNKASDIKLLDEYKEEILKKNGEIDDIKFQLEILPKEIREANFQLLTATVQYGYSELKDKEKTLNKSVEEIDNLRKRLKELLEIKHDNEEWINETYTFLHGILGNEVIEEIDRKKFK